jgi:hypothetical protein
MTLKNWKDARHLDKVKRAAKEAGFEIKNGKGSHYKIEDPITHEHVIGYYTKEMSTGVAMQIYKFFLKHAPLEIFIILAIILVKKFMSS